jgi:antitoxin FitA
MANLTVRNIEASLISKLKRRAKRHSRSVQQEVREILRDATKHETTHGGGLGTRIASRFRHAGLKPGERIHEIRDILLQVPNFENDSK